jgi:hypothetical protein
VWDSTRTLEGMGSNQPRATGAASTQNAHRCRIYIYNLSLLLSMTITHLINLYFDLSNIRIMFECELN